MQTKISPQNDKLSIRSTVMEDDMRRRGKEDNHEFVPVPGKVRASLPKQCRLKAVDIISAPVAAARVRTGISDRQAVHILAATRVDDAKVNDIALLRSNVQRARKKRRSEKQLISKKHSKSTGSSF